MSWYSQQAAQFLGRQQMSSLRYSYSPELRQVTMTLIISDMRTNEDVGKISNTLRNLLGVISVNVVPERRQVVITYYLPQISLEIIGEHITKLGYHYIHKS